MPEALNGSPLQVVLYQPEIPQNTGNVARTCAATHTPLHLVEPLGFRITDRHLKRAGLDYWPHVTLQVHQNLDAARKQLTCCRWILFSAGALRPYYDFQFLPGDCLVFGSESKGLPDDLLKSCPDLVLQIPIDRTRVRSLNLATTVGVALFEASRQLAFCR
jgi:tRNA (cytidine/uridine-2'-O-)-methyltransferase